LLKGKGENAKNMKIGVVGSTGFANAFIPLFKAHPLVDGIAVAELVPERLKTVAERYELKETYSSFDELCRSDVDAIAIITQRHLHADQTIQALKAGKHVLCAVPIAQSLEEIAAIIQEVNRSGLIYMSAETSYYYPCTIYCREQFKKGKFGKFVYGEACYMHDMSHGFYDAFKHSGGKDWKKVAGFPPMYYPTHSTSMIVSATGARATHVSCLGYRDQHEDGIFREGANLWDNPFSNQTALMRMSDGGMARINEFRRVGWMGETNNSVHMSMFGTEGSYEEQANAKVWTSLNKEDITDLKELLTCKEMKVPDYNKGLHNALQEDFYKSVSHIHPIERLPKEYAGLTNGHFGSHQFLVDDFVKAVDAHKLPPNHVWDAAKYSAPGLIAHESAKREGEMMPIPDFGKPPAHWEFLYSDDASASR
jgi:predicted dehydrogenase